MHPRCPRDVHRRRIYRGLKHIASKGDGPFLCWKTVLRTGCSTKRHDRRVEAHSIAKNRRGFHFFPQNKKYLHEGHRPPIKKGGKRCKLAHSHLSPLHTWVRPVWTVVDSPIWSEVHCSIGAMRRDPPTVMRVAKRRPMCHHKVLPSLFPRALSRCLPCLDRGRPRARPPRRQGGYQ